MTYSTVVLTSQSPYYTWCALGEPIGGLTYMDRPGCTATTRLMNEEDVEL